MFKQQSMETPQMVSDPSILTIEELEKKKDAVCNKLDAVRKTITGRMTLQQDVEMRALLEELDNLYEQAERIASKPINDAANK